MDHFQYRSGEYFAEDVPVQALAAQFGTPFYCYSHATLVHHYKIFSEHFSGLDHLVCYAVKANSNLAVLRTLAQAGAGADVVSQGEIMLAVKAGIPPGKIVFSGVGKTRGEMAYALETGVLQFNVESGNELLALSEAAVSQGTQARIAIRVNPDIDPKTHAKISTGQKESKFGVSIHLAAALYAQAARLPGIAVQGVSMHIGSQLTDLEPFSQAFAKLRVLVDELRAAGHRIDTVDLGGGLGIPYGQKTPPLPDAYAQVVRDAMHGVDATLIFEPGRLLVGNAGILVSRVIYVKQTPTRNFIILDAGMNDLMRPSLYGAHHDILPVLETPAGQKVLADIVGPVCETGDIFAEQRSIVLPRDGDLMAIRSAGAYGAVMASSYNARPLVAEVMVQGGQYHPVRARQTYAELIGGHSLPEWLA